MDQANPRPFENLYWTRESANLNQTQMGFLIGTSSSQYGKIEAGHVSLDLHRIRICHLLGLKWPQLSVPLTEYNQQYRDRAVKVLLHRMETIHEVIGHDIGQLDELSNPSTLKPLIANSAEAGEQILTSYRHLLLRIDPQGRPVLISGGMELVIDNDDAPIVGLALQAIGGAA